MPSRDVFGRIADMGVATDLTRRRLSRGAITTQKEFAVRFCGSRVRRSGLGSAISASHMCGETLLVPVLLPELASQAVDVRSGILAEDRLGGLIDRRRIFGRQGPRPSPSDSSVSSYPRCISFPAHGRGSFGLNSTFRTSLRPPFPFKDLLNVQIGQPELRSFRAAATWMPPKGDSADVEGLAAAALARLVGVVEDELPLEAVLDPVDLGADDVDQRHRVHIDRLAILLDLLVVLAGLVGEVEIVLLSRAPGFGDGQTERLVLLCRNGWSGCARRRCR